MRLVWLSDLHLDHLEQPARAALAQRVRSAGPDRVVVTGDITQAPRLERDLPWLPAAFGCPVDFVLGNHDYYRGSFATVHSAVREVADRTDGLCWLDEAPAGVVPLGERFGLLGCGGWGDGRLGSGSRCKLRLNDHVLIHDLAVLDHAQLYVRLGELGDAAAAHLRSNLPGALQRFAGGVVVATHVPPFRAACWHQGQISSAEWLPHFTCHAVGQVLVDVMTGHPDQQLIVLCGHTHGAGVARILPNLEVRTAGTDYGEPLVEGVLEMA